MRLSYRELDNQARSVAGYLDSIDARGQRAILMLDQPEAFIAAFFGCLYGGVIPVPSFSPKNERASNTLLPILFDSQATIIFSEASELTQSRLSTAFSAAASTDAVALRWVNLQQVVQGWANHASFHRPDLEKPAFLQYTSGSTSTPRGIMVHHSHLMACERNIRQAFGHTSNLIVCSWLPLFHDMGLVGMMMQTVFVGGTAVMFTPTAFIQRPIRWLNAISKYGANTSGAPNFAYDLCVQRVTQEECGSIDLSRWSLAFNGAEPINAATIDAFCKKFKPFGFSRSSIYPCYGLAEATLLVSGASPKGGPVTRTFDSDQLSLGQAVPPATNTTRRRDLVSVGTAPSGQVVIADPESTQRLTVGQVGEVLVHGPHVTAGYWNDPARTQATFHARVDGCGETLYLRTGDLGFLYDDELYIVGRIKDLIVVRGQNHYPSDLERTIADTCPGTRFGRTAVFAIDVTQKEEVCVVQEAHPKTSTEDFQQAVTAIQRAIFTSHGLMAHSIVFVKTGSIPKTSSGKIQRNRCRTMLATEQLPALFQWSAEPDGKGSPHPSTTTTLTGMPNPSNLVKKIAEEIALAVNLPRESIDIDAPLVSLGLSSLSSVQVLANLSRLLQIEISPTVLYNFPTIRTLGMHLSSLLHESTGQRAKPNESKCDGDFPQAADDSQRHPAPPELDSHTNNELSFQIDAAPSTDDDLIHDFVNGLSDKDAYAVLMQLVRSEP
jgi:acyl-CoA synthetase (AMP-forming)/AMP-acid ligase II/acyl carrier protein